jgi:urease accessory protein
VHLHNVSGGILSRDCLEIDIQLDGGAQAQITTTSATRVYRARQDDGAAHQKTWITVGEGVLLEMLPDPVIPFAGSRYWQTTRVVLGDGAGLTWWETIAPGRAASGELFAYDFLRIETEIVGSGRPIVLEMMQLEPSMRPLESSARFGDYRYFSTLYICKVGIEAAQWLRLEAELGEIAIQLSQPSEVIWGVSTLVRHGLVVRALSRRGRDLPAGLFTFWQAAKRALYDQDAVLPRKIY